MKRAACFFCFLLLGLRGFSQDAASLLQKVKAKWGKVNDYVASGEMKTNISFLKVPDAEVKVYFKKPDKLRIINEKGISLVPKGLVSISLGNLLDGKYQVLDAGTDQISGLSVRIIKLLPLDENAELVLASLYIDPLSGLVLKSKTTTRSNGTNQLELQYGRYSAFALPDKVIFTFNTQDYKLPKGITFDYDDGTHKTAAQPAGNQTGKIEISYSNYQINKGVPDTIFKQ